MALFGHVRFAAGSDVGRRRSNNEDAYGVFPSIGAFCVADGMGGGDDGEVASAAAVKAVESFATSHPHPLPKAWTRDSMIRAIRTALDSASGWIFRRAEDHELKGCGSTFVSILLNATDPSAAVALHAGDSRLYRIRDGEIVQLTRDHSPAAMIGADDEKEVNPMFRGMILRAVGVRPAVELEETNVDVRPGDRFLLCSDGLYRMVPERKIIELTAAAPDPQAAIDSLIAAANAAGGVDNVTAELLEIGELPDAVEGEELPEIIPDGVGVPQDDRPTGDTDPGTGFNFDTVGSLSSRTSMNDNTFTSGGMPIGVTAQTGPESDSRAKSSLDVKGLLHGKAIVLSALAAIGIAVVLAVAAWLASSPAVPAEPPHPPVVVEDTPPELSPEPPPEDNERIAKRGKLVADIEDLLTDMPVADRRERLNAAKALLNKDSEDEKLIGDEVAAEYRVKISSAEGCSVAEIKNKCRVAVTIDGNVIPAGRTLPIRYEAGTKPNDWNARSEEHEAALALPADFDGITIDVAEEMFVSADKELEHGREIERRKNRMNLYYVLEGLLKDDDVRTRLEHLDDAQKLLDDDENGARLFKEGERAKYRKKIERLREITKKEDPQ